MSAITPAQTARHYLTMPEETIDALDSFLFWLEYDHPSNQSAPTDEEFAKVAAWVKVFLGNDPKILVQAEQDMLAKWIEAVDMPQ